MKREAYMVSISLNYIPDQILNFKVDSGKRGIPPSPGTVPFQAKDKEIFLCRDWHPAPNMNLCH